MPLGLGTRILMAYTRFVRSSRVWIGVGVNSAVDAIQLTVPVTTRRCLLPTSTVTCAAWSTGNVVLLGDAAHTAHYSIGSGTKLAMEDGIALATAIDEADDLRSALQEYERVRRPAVEHLQDTARRSMRWWDTFPDRLDLPIEQLLIAYMTRAGKVTVDRFATLAEDIVQRGLAQGIGRRALVEKGDGGEQEA